MKRKRPLLITLVCLFGFVGGLAAITMAFSQQFETIGRVYPAFLLLSAVSGLVCFAGLWMMMQWSVVAYTIMAAVNQAILNAIGSWSVAALVVPSIVVAIGTYCYSSMKS